MSVEVTGFVCGTDRCADGEPHDNKDRVEFRDEQGRLTGESVACSRCGSTAMDHDLLRLP